MRGSIFKEMCTHQPNNVNNDMATTVGTNMLATCMYKDYKDRTNDWNKELYRLSHQSVISKIKFKNWLQENMKKRKAENRERWVKSFMYKMFTYLRWTFNEVLIIMIADPISLCERFAQTDAYHASFKNRVLTHWYANSIQVACNQAMQQRLRTG